MEEKKHLLGRVLFGGKEDELINEANLWWSQMKEERYRTGRVRGTHQSARKTMKRKKYFGVDILPYGKKPPAKEEVVVEGVTSDNGNNNDGSINSKISSKVPETVNMSKDSPHAIMLSAFPSSTSPWSTTLSSATHAICCAH